MDDTARTEVTLTIRRRASVSDGQGNTYGILDVSPEDDDPAILLGVRIGAGERFGLVLRPGARLETDGLDLTVAELSTDEPARVRLTGSVPTAAPVEGGGS